MCVSICMPGVDGVVEDASGKIDGGKGKIGPCYSTKVARNGVTFWMLCKAGGSRDYATWRVRTGKLMVMLLWKGTAWKTRSQR